MADRVLYLFPDTNLFIQCRPLPDIDWTKWGSFDEIHLLVCRPVQSEIDNQKNRGNGRVARRATTAYRMFRGIITEDVGYSLVRPDHPRVALYLDASSRPSSELVEQLDYGKPDDEIVGHCYRYKQEHVGADVRLLTHDGGAMMASKSIGLPFEPIPDSWILPAENGAVERENARLKDEINRLKKAEPEFRIRCLDDRGRAVETLEIECQVYQPLAEDDIAGLIETLKKRCPVSDDFGPRQLGEQFQHASLSAYELLLRPSRVGEVFIPASHQEIAAYREQDYPRWISNCQRIFSNLHLAPAAQRRPAIRPVRGDERRNEARQGHLGEFHRQGRFPDISTLG